MGRENRKNNQAVNTGTHVRLRKWLIDGDRIRGGETEIAVRLAATESSLAETLIGDMPNVSNMGAAVVSPDSPELIGNYQTLEEIGRGSMGIVFRAKHIQSQQIVALKTISPQFQLNQQLEKSFIREAGILCRMSHKRIVEFIEVGSEGDCLFMAMEYVKNIDLTRALAKLSFGKRIRIASRLMLQVLEGLEYVHSQGLVHRDLKPKNILVANTGGRLSATLADFGLAKNFEEAGMSQISSEHEIKGTLCFIAPDQIINSRNVTPSVDIFSAGATLYTLLSDEVIYDLDSHHTPIAAILNNGPVPLNVRCPQIPDSLCKLVEKATRPTAAERFSSAEEMRSQLQSIVRRF